jgi:hypothetical protein
MDVLSGTRTRALATLCAASLLFFIGYTAPHRVHHFFDAATSPAHATSDSHHDQSGPSRDATSDPECVFQASANRCADGLNPTVSAWQAIAQRQTFLLPDDSQFFKLHIPAPFQSRAPPVA